MSRKIEARHWPNPWLEFEDSNGYGWAQPDFVCQRSDGLLIVVEIKLTETLDLRQELEDLYLPLCCAAFGPVAAVGLGLFRHAISDIPDNQTVPEFRDLLSYPPLETGQVLFHQRL